MLMPLRKKRPSNPRRISKFRIIPMVQSKRMFTKYLRGKEGEEEEEAEDDKQKKRKLAM
jgi:hypothetical protein